MAEMGVRAGLGLGCGGMGDQVPILQYLSTSITYSNTTGKAVDKSNFWNEISQENHKTNALWKNHVNVDIDSYLNMMFKTIQDT